MPTRLGYSIGHTFIGLSPTASASGMSDPDDYFNLPSTDECDPCPNCDQDLAEVFGPCKECPCICHQD